MPMVAYGSVDAYDVVLADLRVQRDKINNAIEAIEALSGVRGPVAQPPPYVPEGPYVGLAIHEAAKLLLKERNKPLSNPDIAAGIKDGGLVMNSADPVNTVGAVLTRRASASGDIIKLGRGVWGLPEWMETDSPVEALKPAHVETLKSWDHVDLE